MLTIHQEIYWKSTLFRSNVANDVFQRHILSLLLEVKVNSFGYCIYQISFKVLKTILQIQAGSIRNVINYSMWMISAKLLELSLDPLATRVIYKVHTFQNWIYLQLPVKTFSCLIFICKIWCDLPLKKNRFSAIHLKDSHIHLELY